MEALKWAPRRSVAWLADMEQAFWSSKVVMFNTSKLAHTSPGAELSLTTDASYPHVGAVLTQHLAGMVDRPLVLYSAKLNKVQAKYSAFNR